MSGPLALLVRWHVVHWQPAGLESGACKCRLRRSAGARLAKFFAEIGIERRQTSNVNHIAVTGAQTIRRPGIERGNADDWFFHDAGRICDSICADLRSVELHASRTSVTILACQTWSTRALLDHVLSHPNLSARLAQSKAVNLARTFCPRIAHRAEQS